MNLEKLINVARGIKKADLVIKDANVVNVFLNKIEKKDIAITDGFIAGIGEGYEGENIIDADNKYVCPSFIDGHIHLESSMCLPSEFARVVVPEGVLSVVADPHEIANVFGLHGISFMREACLNLPLQVYMMLPSCVPATDSETSGFDLATYDLSLLIDKEDILGIAEMMNFPGVCNCDKNTISKIKLGRAFHKKIDGHAPSLSGKDLCAYVASGVMSDHECTNLDEAKEKLSMGMHIMIREGSAAKNLKALIPLLYDNSYNNMCMFVTDDRHPTDLKGHINGMVKTAVENGVDPIVAIKTGSYNTAKYFGLNDLGAIAPGYRANMLILNNLKDFKPELVLKDGEVVAKNGSICVDIDKDNTPQLRGSVNVKWIEHDDFQIEAKGEFVHAIEIIPSSLVTNNIIVKPKIENGLAKANIDDDVLKIVVIERHKATGNIGKGFVKGFGLKKGAIASTVAHDSHNMIVIGTNDKDMEIAAIELVKLQGGKVVVCDGKVIAKLPLPIAGLMSNDSFEEILGECISLKNAAKDLGCRIDDPFMTMAFLSLSVIPELKITDKGVFDVSKNDFIDIFDV